MGNLRAGGASVRGKKQNFLMHHKFAIIDNKGYIFYFIQWKYDQNMEKGEEKNKAKRGKKKAIYLYCFHL